MLEQRTEIVMIVDDSSLQQMVTADNLKSLGFSQIIMAGDYDSALKKFKQGNPELMIIDINLPGKSGIDLMEEIRKSNPDAKIIIQSCISVGEFEKELEDIGLEKSEHEPVMPQYLTKPYSREDLKKVIEKLLSS